MTPDEQLERWVAGDPACPNDRGECCPDFSCCLPALLWPLAMREGFRDAGQPTREAMMLGALGAMLEAEGFTLE